MCITRIKTILGAHLLAEHPNHQVRHYVLLSFSPHSSFIPVAYWFNIQAQGRACSVASPTPPPVFSLAKGTLNVQALGTGPWAPKNFM